MRPKVEALLAERTATGSPSKRAIHASDQAYDKAEYFKTQFSKWKECGFHRRQAHGVG